MNLTHASGDFAKNTMVEASARYEVIFTDRWNALDHVDYPPNAHYSPIVAINHNADYRIFKLGEFATLGFQQLSETGATQTLRDEIAEARIFNQVGRLVLTDPLFPRQDGRQIKFTINVSLDHPLLSFTTMIAPSPDWTVGLDSVNLLEENTFINYLYFELYATNAGTEEGDYGGNFDTNNPATFPQKEISSLQGQLGFNAPFATVTIRKL